MNKKLDVLNKYLNEIEKVIPSKDKRDESISKSTVGWQLDHSLKVINAVSGVIINTNPEKYKRDFNFMRLILFPINYIPRGSAKAPKVVLPPEIISKSSLKGQLQMAKQNIELLKPLPQNSHFIHHVFGMLSKRQTLYFLGMHTKHHLKIVRDILKQ